MGLSEHPRDTIKLDLIVSTRTSVRGRWRLIKLGLLVLLAGSYIGCSGKAIRWSGLLLGFCYHKMNGRPADQVCSCRGSSGKACRDTHLCELSREMWSGF